MVELLFGSLNTYIACELHGFTERLSFVNAERVTFLLVLQFH